MATVSVAVGGASYTLTQAKESIAGYCFAEESLAWGPPNPQVGALPPPLRRPVFAYRSYDCIPADEGVPLGSTDVLVASGLNGQLDVDSVLALRSAAPIVSSVLECIDTSVPFWAIPASHIHPPAVGPQGSQSWFLHRAWFVLMSLSSIGIALTHKTLHHKMPAHFPLLDRRTEAALGSPGLWGKVHADLVGQAGIWEELEDWLAMLASMNRGVKLTRLRLHDILLWLDCTGKRGRAQGYGRAILAGQSHPSASNV